MKKIKVLIDTQPLKDANAIRGIGVYTRELTKALEKKRSIDLRKNLEKLEEHKFSPDIIHYPYFDLFFNTLPLISKTPRVVTIHDVIPLIFSEQYPKGKRGTIVLQKQKLSLKNASGIITDSQTSKQDINKYLSIPLEKIYVVYLAGNPEIKKVTKNVINEIKQKYNLPEKYILYVGDINYNKNIPQLIKTLKFLPNEIKLVCVGKNFYPHSIPEWQWIETQLALSDVAERVIFINDITGDGNLELSAFYSGALAYIQPSLYEGFGLPVLEAMQAKVPVIVSKNSSLLEVGDENVIYSKPIAEDLAKGVEKILSWSQNKRLQWVKKAHKWSQKFSWEKTANETIEVYKKILSN